MIPRGSTLHDTYVKVGDNFGPGKLWPYMVLIIPPASMGGVLTETAWHACQNIVTELAEHSNLYNTSLRDFSFAFAGNGMLTPWELVAPCAKDLASPDCSPLMRNTIQQLVNPEGTGTFGYVMLEFDALAGAHGPQWLGEMLMAMFGMEARMPGWQLSLSGPPTIILSQTLSEINIFPKIIVIILSVAFIVLVVAFKSLVVPVKCLFSIILTEGFVFGLAVLVFEHGILDWMHFAGLSSELGGIQFYLPLAVFSIIVGLCLDYDIFLLTRTQELCEEYLDTKIGISKGLISQGSIISTAGIIMSFAFGGLLFSNIPIVNQLSFFLVTGALYDTFVSCCFITPAMMSLLGDVAWWPGPLFRKLRANRTNCQGLLSGL